MKVYVLCRNFLDKESLSKLTIGGVQTYIDNLIPVISSFGCNVVVIQYSKRKFSASYKGATVIGVTPLRSRKKSEIKMLNLFLSLAVKGDLLIYSQDTLFHKPIKYFSIAIQHGIGWDIIDERKVSLLRSIRTYCDKLKLLLWYLKVGKYVDKLVCVDYNFINWFRASSRYNPLNYLCIPNFAEVPSERFEKPKGIINIVFARRFEDYRGAILFARAAKKILETYQNIQLFIAGEGPCENEMRSLLSNYKQVMFTKYRSDESLLFHHDKHIAVVPTKGSEGTSLSLLEAMASNCAVIATDVGGMTNIVIDGYNGLLVRPKEDDLVKALKTLIENNHMRESLSSNGYQTVKDGFSKKAWEDKWKSTLSLHLLNK